jgi:exosome complex protein LRP1
VNDLHDWPLVLAGDDAGIKNPREERSMAPPPPPHSTDPEEVAAVATFSKALGHVRAQIAPLSLISRAEAKANLSPAEAAKLNVALAYTCASLFYMYLKARGADVESHPVKAELERIKRYVARLKAAQGDDAAPAGQGGDSRPAIDKAASKRFVVGALQGNDSLDRRR